MIKSLAMNLSWRRSCLSLLAFALVACGGGGGGGGSSAASGVTPNPTPAPAPAPEPPTQAQLREAAKLASIATFGMNYAGIEAMAVQGTDAWLDAQLRLPIGFNQPVVTQLEAMLANDELPEVDDVNEHRFRFRRYAWWHNAMTSEDQLRQRVAYALSQIMVTSDNVGMLNNNPYALSVYYDVLLRNAFGNFRDLLDGVAFSPAMGIYLSHANNPKADPEANRFPDENFAREVMQLFTIGLHELNPDGSERLDADGRPIPTYDNERIRQMAKVFTGLSFGGPGAYFGKPTPVFRAAMIMFDEYHEPGEKLLLNGLVVPAGQTGLQDISMALDNLFNHPNVGPFIGKQLIMRLVTSNPSPQYVARVTAAFNGDATGVRGDMQAVVRAILTDPEVQTLNDSDAAGRLREPLVRFLQMARGLNATATDNLFYNDGYLQQFLLRQHPLSAPSVFNFYQPGYSPAGELAAAGLVGPEFQITDDTSIVTVTNMMHLAIFSDRVMDIREPFGAVNLDFTQFEALNAQGLDVLLDRLDTQFMFGELRPDTRAVIKETVLEIEDAALRTKAAVYMVLVSPDYVVEQ